MDCAATQMFKSLAASNRSDGSIHINDCPGGSLNIFAVARQREEVMNTGPEREDINAVTSNLSVPSNAESRTQARSISSLTVGSRDYNKRVLHHRPSPLRAAWSDPTQEKNEATTAQQPLSALTPASDSSVQRVQPDDGIFEFSRDSMIFNNNNLSTPLSDPPSEASTPRSESPKRQFDHPSKLSDCMCASNCVELLPAKANGTEQSIPHLGSPNSEPRYTAPIDEESATADNASPPTHTHFRHVRFAARHSSQPKLTITTTTTTPRLPKILIPRVPASARLSTLAVSANPRLARQPSNLEAEDVRFWNHRDSVALSRLRLRAGAGESADRSARGRHGSGE